MSSPSPRVVLATKSGLYSTGRADPLGLGGDAPSRIVQAEPTIAEHE